MHSATLAVFVLPLTLAGCASQDPSSTGHSGLIAGEAWAVTAAPTGNARAIADPAPPLPEVLPDAPADFALAVSVISPQGLRTTNQPLERRAARYIVDPDWQLRAQVGTELPRTVWPRTGGADRTLPGLTRQLTRAQVARLWWLLNQSGATLPSAQRASAPPNTYQPPREHLVYVVSFTGDGRRSWAVLDDQPLAVEPASPLVRELAALAYQE